MSTDFLERETNRRVEERRAEMLRTVVDLLDNARDATADTLDSLESALVGVEEALTEARGGTMKLARENNVNSRGVVSVSVCHPFVKAGVLVREAEAMYQFSDTRLKVYARLREPLTDTARRRLSHHGSEPGA